MGRGGRARTLSHGLAAEILRRKQQVSGGSSAFHRVAAMKYLRRLSGGGDAFVLTAPQGLQYMLPRRTNAALCS
jgi:hypothetical protein